MVMTTSAVSTLIYQNAGSMQAAAAGFILLSMIAVRRLFFVFLHITNQVFTDHLDLLLRISSSGYSPTICGRLRFA